MCALTVLRCLDPSGAGAAMSAYPAVRGPDAGAPPEALVPLMERTIANDFELTGPIARGDAATIERHLAAIRSEEPELELLYTALAEATRA